MRRPHFLTAASAADRLLAGWPFNVPGFWPFGSTISELPLSSRELASPPSDPLAADPCDGAAPVDVSPAAEFPPAVVLEFEAAEPSLVPPSVDDAPVAAAPPEAPDAEVPADEPDEDELLPADPPDPLEPPEPPPLDWANAGAEKTMAAPIRIERSFMSLSHDCVPRRRLKGRGRSLTRTASAGRS